MSAPDTLSRLVDELGNPEQAVHEQAESTLLLLGAGAVQPLITAMFSDNMGKAWRAARVLSQIDDPRRVEPMRWALASKNYLVGQVAVETLEAAVGAGRTLSETVDSFIEALPDAWFIVQLHLVAALERLGDKRAIEPLTGLLRTTASPELRYTVIQALGALGAAQAVELIRSFQDDDNHHVRERTQIALERLGALGD